MTNLVPLSLLSVLLISGVHSTNTGYRRPLCNEGILWAPFNTVKPFTALLNSAYCPSWTTRHLLTKESQFTHLTLPYGMPFSFFCGACYKGSTDLAKTLTLKQKVDWDAASPYNLNQVSIKTREGALEFSENGHKCMVEYGITPPLQNSGSLICETRLGKFYNEETATFSVVKTPIVKTNETLEVRTDTVTLVCPEHPMPQLTNALTHVWYLPDSPGKKLAASTNNPQVKFRVIASKPLVVACATFHIYGEDRVIEKTFIVRKISTGSFRAQQPSENTQQDYHEGVGPGKAADSYQVYGEDEVAQSVSTAGGGLNIVVIIVISTTAVILVLIGLISLPKCLKSRSRR